MPNEWRTIKSLVHKNSTSRSTRERNYGGILLARKIRARTAEGRWEKNPVYKIDLAYNLWYEIG